MSDEIVGLLLFALAMLLGGVVGFLFTAWVVL